MTSIFVTSRLYTALFVVIIIMIMSTFVPILYTVGAALLIIIIVLTLYDVFMLLAAARKVSGSRSMSDPLSLGDAQSTMYTIKNDSDARLNIDIIDELPVQYQFRKYIDTITIEPFSTQQIDYQVRPTSRGEYHYGRMSAMLSSRLGLIKYQTMLSGELMVKVYPSIIQMKKYALMMSEKSAQFLGIRKVRSIGENDEFEHIRNYVVGDNVKSINWKASSRSGEILVNQYQDSRSQMVFCVIDKGRTMEMPFEGLSLLDYVINSSLVISNIVLQKYDKAGIITFSNKIDQILSAESNTKHLESVLSVLYNQETDFKESNFSLLFHTIRSKISKRSVLFLFTNFEDKYDLERNIVYFKKLNQHHLLVVISFINTEVEKEANAMAKDKSGVYRKVVAQTIIRDQELIIRELRSVGIQTILCRPSELSINVINKYLEIKAKRMK